MPFGSFDNSPDANSIWAAYRPIIFDAIVSGDLTTQPVIYCDVYFDGIFYKTLSKTVLLAGTTDTFRFDIQDAAQEYLGSFIGENGGGGIVVAPPLVTAAFVKIRGSSYDVDGFIIPDPAIPIQGTGNTSPTAGGGSASATFYIVNATLQHEQSQDLADHLEAYEFTDLGDWGATTYPLTHRPNNYKVCVDDSDYFPILTDQTPTGVRIHYKLKGSNDFTDGEGSEICSPVGPLPSSLPNAAVNEPYDVEIPLTGTAPFELDTFAGPSWMSANIVDGFLVLTGTPIDADAATGVSVIATVSNCEGGNTSTITTTINVIACIAVGVGATALPDARAGEPFNAVISLTGDAPFVIDSFTLSGSWMTATIVGNNLVLSGTPTDGDVDTAVLVEVVVLNCSGTQSDTYSDTIDILPSNNFTANAAVNFRINNITGINTPSPTIFPTAINGQKKGHHTGLSSTYSVNITGTIVTTTHLSTYVNGTRIDCQLIGSVVGTVISAVNYNVDVTAAEEDNVVFSIEAGLC